MDALTLSLLAAGGVVAVSAAEAKAPAPAARRPISRGAVGALALSRMGFTGKTDPLVSSPPAGTSATGYPKEVIDKALAEAEKRWAEMSAAARKEACERLKKQYPSEPSIQDLDCASSTFGAIVTATAAAIGTAIGGPIGGALAVAFAACFQEKLEAWLDEAWATVKSEIEEWQWDATADACRIFRSESEVPPGYRVTLRNPFGQPLGSVYACIGDGSK